MYFDGHAPPPPDSIFCAYARIVHLGARADGAVVRERLGDQRLFGGIGDMEARVFHAKRIKQPLLLELIERFARDDLDHPAEHVDGLAVVPGRAGLIGQWHFREPLGELRQVGIALAELGFHIGLLDHALAEKAVSESRGVMRIRSWMVIGRFAGDEIEDASLPSSSLSPRHRPSLIGKGRNVFRQAASSSCAACRPPPASWLPPS